MALIEAGALSLISTTTVSLQTAAATTLLTVPTGFRFVPFGAAVRCGSATSPTAIVTFGQVGALTDFLGSQTMTNLVATYDTVWCLPIPNATPVKCKSYAAGTVFQINVGTADVDGSTDAIVDLFGFLYAI